MSVRDELSELRNEVKEVQVGVTQIIEYSSKFSSMLGTILREDSKVPLLMIMLPDTDNVSHFSLSSVYSHKMRIFFVCPITKFICKSGKDQQGYKIDIPKAWVATVIPVLQLSLFALRIYLLSMGLPFPIPGLSQTLVDLSFLNILEKDLGLKNKLCSAIEFAKSECSTSDIVDSGRAFAKSVEMSEARYCFFCIIDVIYV